MRMRRIATMAGALAGIALSAIGVSATGAQAAQAGTCTGKTDGICLYRDASGGVWGWMPVGRNISWLGDWNYASTSETMQDSISSVRNPSTCSAFLYWDADYQGSSNEILPGTARTYLGSSWNDQTSSVYWNC